MRISLENLCLIWIIRWLLFDVPTQFPCIPIENTITLKYLFINWQFIYQKFWAFKTNLNNWSSFLTTEIKPIKLHDFIQFYSSNFQNCSNNATNFIPKFNCSTFENCHKIFENGPLIFHSILASKQVKICANFIAGSFSNSNEKRNDKHQIN